MTPLNSKASIGDDTCLSGDENSFSLMLKGKYYGSAITFVMTCRRDTDEQGDIKLGNSFHDFFVFFPHFAHQIDEVNVKERKSKMDKDVLIGLGGCAIASLAFGSMYVPMKHQKSKNPFFLQWLISVGIILIGYVIQAVEGFPPFYPFAMVGGFFWTVASLCSLPVIERVGMAVGMLLWNTSNCLIGWASGRFGLLGIKQTIPERPWLNFIGLCIMLTGGAAFALVRVERKSENHLPTPIGTPKELQKILRKRGVWIIDN
uniref:Transmembrane protein 144 n=1 Tax=Steinernema glaseri TaxID=37863 RepID=A0A1I8AC73_9BILA